MIPLNLNQIQAIVNSYYGIEIISKLSQKIDSPDSAAYFITDANGTNYILREADYFGELDFEKNTVEEIFDIELSGWVGLLKENNSVARNKQYVATPGLYYALGVVA